MKIKHLALGALGALVLTGCATTAPTTSYRQIPITAGTLVNQNLTIRADDGTFTLRGGQQFTTPFAGNVWNSACPGAVYNDTSAQFLTMYRAALNCGAARTVTIDVPGRDRPLYGVLMFNNAIPSSRGPGSQSYYVSIPQARIDAAYAGQTTAAYESVDWVASWSDGSSSNQTWYSWILWMSSTPLR